jgi:hypothetical protein
MPVTIAGFRRVALSLPGAVEQAHMAHPDFRVGGKIFATLGYPDADWGMVKLQPSQQAEFVAAAPDVFRPVGGGWGLRGATSVNLAKATVRVLRPALLAAWQNLAGAPTAKRAGARQKTARKRKA